MARPYDLTRPRTIIYIYIYQTEPNIMVDANEITCGIEWSSKFLWVGTGLKVAEKKPLTYERSPLPTSRVFFFS